MSLKRKERRDPVVNVMRRVFSLVVFGLSVAAVVTCVAGHVKVRNSEQGRRPSPPCPCLGPSLFLAEFGLSFPVAVAFNHDNLGVVGEAIDQRDRAGGVGKDGVPVLERQVRRHEQGAVFIAAADDLEEEVGGVGIVGEVANLVDGEEGGPRAVAEAPLKGAGGLLAIEIEQQVRGRDEARAVAGQDDLMDDVLGEHRFAEALGADQEDILGAGKEVEGEDAVEGGAVERGRPVPVPVGDGFEAAEAGGGEPAFDTAALPLLEFGSDEVLEEDGGAPAVAGGAGKDVVEVVGRPQQPEASEVTRQGRRDVG